MITLCDMAKYHPSLNELTSTEQWGGVHNKYIAPAQICIPLIVFRSPTKSKSILPSLHLSESPTLCMSILPSLHLSESPTLCMSILPSLHLSESPTLCMSILLSLHL